MDDVSMKDPKLRNALLLQLVENAQEGIVVAEKEGDDTILIYVNPAFEALTGYTPDEILYRDCRFLQGEETQQPAVKEIRNAINSSKPVRTILKNFRKDGSVFWNELSVTPFYDEVDEVTYYIGIQKDVTAEVELSQKLEAAEIEIQRLNQLVGNTEKLAD
jgi:PAS domain S-box-containing protein